MYSVGRITYMDAVKFMTMYLVIMGHVIQMMVDGWRVGEHLWKVIYSFHMPLFILISGYFLSRRVLDMPFLGMLKAKCKQLLLPAITCTAICCVYLFFARDTVNFRDEIIGNSWFLKTLFVYYILFWLIKHTNLNDWLLFAISTILLFLVPKGSSLQVNLLWPFFWTGYFLKKHELLDRIIGKWQFIFLFLIVYISTFVLQWNMNNPNIITINPLTLQSQWHLIILHYVVALSGCMCVILIVGWVYKKWQNAYCLNKIADFGKYTLGVYVLQTILVINIFPDTLAWRVESRWMFDLVITPSLSILFMALCLLIVLLLSKNKVLALLLFGGQYYKR